MSSGAWLEIDLLRQRRQRYGTERPAVVPVRTLLLRGALFGSVLPLILLLSCVWLWFSESRLRQRAVELQPFANEHDLLEVKLQKEKRVLEDAVQINQARLGPWQMSAPAQFCWQSFRGLSPKRSGLIRQKSVEML